MVRGVSLIAVAYGIAKSNCPAILGNDDAVRARSRREFLFPAAVWRVCLFGFVVLSRRGIGLRAPAHWAVPSLTRSVPFGGRVRLRLGLRWRHFGGVCRGSTLFGAREVRSEGWALGVFKSAGRSSMVHLPAREITVLLLLGPRGQNLRLDDNGPISRCGLSPTKYSGQVDLARSSCALW